MIQKYLLHVMLAALLLITLLINSCVFTNEPATPEVSGPCTETGNPAGIRGKIINEQSKPKGGVAVSLYENIGSDTNGTVRLLVKQSSCSNGTFAFSPNANASYSIEAFDTLTQTRARVPSITFLPTLPISLSALRLQKPGGVRGLVYRDSNTLPPGIQAHEKILIRLIHTDQSWVTDSSGKFFFSSVSAGVYRIAFMAEDGHYLSAYSDSFQIEAGEIKALPTKILSWSPFVQPPTPSGLKIKPLNDSIIQLEWKNALVDTPFHFEIARFDSISKVTADTLLSLTNAYLDTLPLASRGHAVTYRLRLINRLHNASEWSGGEKTNYISPQPLPSELVNLFVNVSENQIAAANIMVRAYRNPTSIGSLDSLPLQPIQIDSALTDLMGNVNFQNLPLGDFSLEATNIKNGTKAIKIHAKGFSQNPSVFNPIDTLKLAAPGSLKGLASRQKAWVTNFTKGNENILASLIGTQYQGETGFGLTPSDSEFVINGIAPGIYQLVIYALPEGYFLADTQLVTIYPNDTTRAKKINCEYNPHATPLKPHGLRVNAYVKNLLTLNWSSVTETIIFGGYKITRIETHTGKKFVSETINSPVFIDDLSTIATGTKLEYLVQTVTNDGRTSLYGGDDLGKPVIFIVP